VSDLHSEPLHEAVRALDHGVSCVRQNNQDHVFEKGPLLDVAAVVMDRQTPCVSSTPSA